MQGFLQYLYSYFVPEEPDSGSNQGQTVLSIPLEGLIIGQDQYGEQNGLCFIKLLILVRPYETLSTRNSNHCTCDSTRSDSKR